MFGIPVGCGLHIIGAPRMNCAGGGGGGGGGPDPGRPKRNARSLNKALVGSSPLRKNGGNTDCRG
jgi:hypothetical protein